MKKISQIENELQGVKYDDAEVLYHELYTTFKSISTTILEGGSSVCVADDGERKFMVILSGEYWCVDCYKVITEQQYNSLVQQ
jgi:hypothetical protein